MSTVNVSNLPVIDELFEEDMVLVQAKDRTGLLKFSDLVVGEQQVSFYNEIVNARNAITGISQSTSDNTELLADHTATINDIQSTTSLQQTTVSELQEEITTLTEENTNLKSTVTELQTALENQLEQTAVAVTKMDQAISINTSLQQSITAVNTNVMTMTQRVDNLQASINGCNTSIYTIDSRVTALE